MDKKSTGSKSSYVSGLELGLSGQVPPTDLNVVENNLRTIFDSLGLNGDYLKPIRFRDPFEPRLRNDFSMLLGIHTLFPTPEPIPEKFNFRKGYCLGLEQFLIGKGVDLKFSHTGIFGVNVITMEGGLEGFLKGMNLEAPGVERSYLPIKDDWRFLKGEIGEIFAAKERRRENMKDGYALGFIVKIAREYGVTLDGLFEVPRDNVSYEVFMSGLKGEANPNHPNDNAMPFYGSYHAMDSRYLSRSRDFLDTTIDYSYSDEKTYKKGLSIWLKSQNIKGVSPDQIMHPEALKAFKAAFSGEALPEYEPKKPAPTVWPTTKTEDKIFIKKLYDENIETRAYTIREHQALIHGQGQLGYMLGKAARSRMQD